MGTPGYRDHPPRAWEPAEPTDVAEAEEFLRLLHDEHPNLGPVRHRLNRLFMVALPRLNRPRCPFSDQPASRPGTPPARTPDRYADTSIQ